MVCFYRFWCSGGDIGYCCGAWGGTGYASTDYAGDQVMVLGYNLSGSGGTWCAFTDSAFLVVVFVIVMVLLALAMLPLIMQVAKWWYWSSL